MGGVLKAYKIYNYGKKFPDKIYIKKSKYGHQSGHGPDNPDTFFFEKINIKKKIKIRTLFWFRDTCHFFFRCFYTKKVKKKKKKEKNGKKADIFLNTGRGVLLADI